MPRARCVTIPPCQHQCQTKNNSQDIVAPITSLASASLSTTVPNCITDLKRSIPHRVNERARMDFSERAVTKGVVESAPHTGRSRLQAVATAHWHSSLFLYRHASSLQRVRRRLADEMAVAPQPATPIGASAATTLRMPASRLRLHRGGTEALSVSLPLA
jgi:hypothetical protein